MTENMDEYKDWPSGPFVSSRPSGIDPRVEEFQKTEEGRRILNFWRQLKEEDERLRNSPPKALVKGQLPENFVSAMFSDPQTVDWLRRLEDKRPPKPHLSPEVVEKLEERLLVYSLLDWHFNGRQSRYADYDAVDAEKLSSGKKRKRRKGGPK